MLLKLVLSIFLDSYEKWPVTHGQTIYSAFTLLVQYALPILIISVLHTQICQRLRLRHSKMGSMSSQNSHRQIEERKASIYCMIHLDFFIYKCICPVPLISIFHVQCSLCYVPISPSMFNVQHFKFNV